MKFILIFEALVKGAAELLPIILKRKKRKKTWPIVNEEAPQAGAVEQNAVM